MSRPTKLVNGKRRALTDAEWAEYQQVQSATPTLSQRQETAKAECRRRIVAVVDETAQINLAAAAGADALTAEQLVTYKAGLGWIMSMRATWQGLAENSSDVTNDENWPKPTQAMIDLANAF